MNPTTRIRHLQLDYLSSQSWSVSPVVIEDPIEGRYLKYNHEFTWGTLPLLPDDIKVTSGTINFPFKYNTYYNNYIAFEPADHLYPGENVGMVIEPRIVNIDEEDKTFFSIHAHDYWNDVEGNVRGNYSVDMQLNRDHPSQVASGDYSAIIGGEQITSSGYYSTNVGAFRGVVEGNYSTNIGQTGLVTGNYSTKCGNFYGVISGDYSTACTRISDVYGNHCTVHGTINDKITHDYCASMGYRNVSGNDYSFYTGYDGDNTGTRVMTVGGPDGNNNMFSVLSDGNCYADISFVANQSGDVAEYYETSGSKLPVGTTVVFTNVSQFIRASTVEDDSDTIIGVVSDTAGMLLNTHEEHWQGKYITRIEEDVEDIYEYMDEEYEEERITVVNGIPYLTTVTNTRTTVVTEEVDIFDPDTDEIVKTKTMSKIKCSRPILKKVQDISPEYNEELEYIPRHCRDEWHAIGLLGKCKILKGQVVGRRWLLIDSTDELYDWYLIR